MPQYCQKRVFWFYALILRALLFGAIFIVGIFIWYHPVKATNEMNTLVYPLAQQESSQSVSGGTSVESILTGLQNFTFFIGDEAQLVKGVFFEISGISNSAATNTIDISIDESGYPYSSGRQKQYLLTSSSRETPFKFLYDATTYIDADIQRVGRGTYGPYTLNIHASSTVSLWSVRMVITYKHKPGGGGGGPIPAEGWYESPVFEATTGGESSGIKSGFNTLGWTEVKPASTTVQFQIATSDSFGGPWTYYGPDELTSSYYDYSQSNYCAGGSGTYACRISPDHNNKRYFRYKIHLCNENGCGSGTAGNSTPQVTKVILNWSP